MQNSRRHWLWAAIALLLAALACNFSPNSGPSINTAGTLTAVAQQLSAAPPQASTSTPTPEDGEEETDTPEPDQGDDDDVSAGPTACLYNAAYVKDVTIPDGTEVTAGEKFTKTWEINNNGCRDWPSGTKLVFVDGEKLGGPDAVEVTATQVGQTRQISVELTAPTTAGEYTGYWKMQSPDGFEFGDRIFVSIKSVAKADTPTPTTEAKEDRPDLTITAITILPDPPVTKNKATMTVTVKNQGKKASSKAVLEADIQDQTAQKVDVPALDPDKTYDATFEVSYDTAGEYTLSFTVDADNDNVESDETNNKSVKTSKFYTVEVFASATVTVQGSFCLDVEAGGSACDADADIWWHAVSSSEKYLEPQNSAKMIVTGKTAITYTICATTGLSGSPIDGSPGSGNKISDGTYICVKTSAGHYASLLIVTYGDNLEIKFTTWKLKSP